MSLSNRVEKLEEAITPPGQVLFVHRYSCMSDQDLQRAIRRQLGRAPRPDDVIHICALHDFAGCPDGPHTHTEAAHGP